ncbi:MAG: SHOCT domain-containing protein [Gordonia sp. (in: high G+C Gram-positive bacteria)]
MRRAGRPGLIGLAARTAVVAGTANAVQNRADNRRVQQAQAAQDQQAWQQHQAQQAAAAQFAAQQQAAQQAPLAAPAAPAAPAIDLTAELTKLADLRTQGLLTDDEFAAAKAKLLG